MSSYFTTDPPKEKKKRGTKKEVSGDLITYIKNPPGGAEPIPAVSTAMLLPLPLPCTCEAGGDACTPGIPSPILPDPMSPRCHLHPTSLGAALRAVGAHPGAVVGGGVHRNTAGRLFGAVLIYFCVISVVPFPSVQNEWHGHGVGDAVMCTGMQSCAHCSSARICLDVVSSFRCRVVYLEVGTVTTQPWRALGSRWVPLLPPPPAHLSAFRSPSVLVEGWSLRTLMHPFICTGNRRGGECPNGPICFPPSQPPGIKFPSGSAHTEVSPWGVPHRHRCCFRTCGVAVTSPQGHSRRSWRSWQRPPQGGRGHRG